jgi:N-acetylmuramoyl-L-alanine amidase
MDHCKLAPALAFALALLLASVAGTTEAKETQLQVLSKIVLDPGHGGVNKGALGYDGAYEKDLVLAIARKVKAALEEATNAEVLLTRDEDKDLGLQERVSFANESEADLFISLHCNSSYSIAPSGVETYVLSEQALQEESAKLARQVVKPRGLYASAADSAAAAVVKEMIQYSAHLDARAFAGLLQSLVSKKTSAVNRGVKGLPIVILRGAEMPGVVIELGFVSNPTEMQNLGKEYYQERIASAVVQAIVTYDDTLARKQSSPSVPPEQASLDAE